jgi:hypothetical protein
MITTEISSAELIQIELQDISGKIIRSQKFLSEPGLNQLIIKNTGGLPYGFYTMHFRSGDTTVQKNS